MVVVALADRAAMVAITAAAATLNRLTVVAGWSYLLHILSTSPSPMATKIPEISRCRIITGSVVTESCRTPFRYTGPADTLPGRLTGVWCNWQHESFWFSYSRFDSLHPNHRPSLIARPVDNAPAVTSVPQLGPFV